MTFYMNSPLSLLYKCIWNVPDINKYFCVEKKVLRVISTAKATKEKLTENESNSYLGMNL